MSPLPVLWIPILGGAADGMTRKVLPYEQVPRLLQLSFPRLDGDGYRVEEVPLRTARRANCATIHAAFVPNDTPLTMESVAWILRCGEIVPAARLPDADAECFLE